MWDVWTRYKTAALGFAVAAVCWPSMIAGSFVPRWAAIAIGVPMVSKMDPRNLPESMQFSLLFLVALGGVSLLGSPYPLAGVQDLLFIIFLCGAFLLGASLDSLTILMRGMACGLALSAGAVVAQNYGWLDLPHDSIQPAGLFFNSELLGEFSALVFVWAAVRRDVLISAIAGLLILMTQSRVGVLAAAVALFYAFRPKSLVLTFALVAAVAMFAIGMMLGFGVDVAKLASAVHRITLWGAAIMAWSLLGNGLGWTTAAFPYEQFVHSDAIQAVTELGLGAIALLTIPFVAFKNNRGTNAERALFLACCIEVIVSFPLHFPATGFVAAVVAGYLVSSRPVVWLGEHLSGTENGFRHQWWDAASTGIVGGGGRLRGALPIRSVFAILASLRARAIGAHTKATG